MSANMANVINTPEGRREEIERGLDSFASPEQNEVENTEEQTTPTRVTEQSTPTSKPKKSGKGKFASLVAGSSASQSQTPSEVPQQQQPGVPPQTQVHNQQQPPASMQSQIPAHNPNDIQQVVTGRIVGAGAKEPAWTHEELSYMRSLKEQRLEIITVNDSRKAIPDAYMKYVVKNPDGTCSATNNAVLPRIPLSEYIIGIGVPKRDDKLPKKKMYSDVVMVGKNKDWILNQWLSEDVIMEPVPASVRNRVQAGRGKTSDRTIGVHFARFGFPVKSFGPIFSSLNSTLAGLTDSLVSTDGYYWANASWGVTQSPGTFVYMTDNGSMASTPQLTDAMEMIGTKSSRGVGTFAISVSCEYQMVGDQVVQSSTKYEFSIKCHNFIHFETTDYHGPPQTSSIGVVMPSDFMRGAQPLSKPKVVSTVMNNTGSLFSGSNLNPFASMNGPSSTQQGEKQGPGMNFL